MSDLTHFTVTEKIFRGPLLQTLMLTSYVGMKAFRKNHSRVPAILEKHFTIKRRESVAFFENSHSLKVILNNAYIHFEGDPFEVSKDSTLRPALTFGMHFW